jgi:phosphoglycolate phosphatase-like HAD superfamily hydrolase
MMAGVIQNIIFDWSGTLVDDLPAVLAATNFVLAEHGIETMTLDKFRAEFCLPFKNFYDRFAPGVPLQRLEESFHGHFSQVQHEITELPHARQFLLFCRKHKIRTFVLSTVSVHYFARQAAVNGFDKFIDRPYPGIWDKRAKIAELLAENQLAAAQTIFIGDMQHDIETAKFEGIGSCAVLTGYNRLEQLRASEPDVIVEHLGELREILERNQFQLRPRPQDIEAAPAPQPVCTVGALVWNADHQVLMKKPTWTSRILPLRSSRTAFIPNNFIAMLISSCSTTPAACAVVATSSSTMKRRNFVG